MDTADVTIRQAMQTVAELRLARKQHPRLNTALGEVKQFQAQRFSAAYADLLLSPRYQGAARFFLNELYGDNDYTQRDQDFARIAGTIGRLFPLAVAETAAALAQAHLLTEQLDDRMARQWLATPGNNPVARYVRCWQQVGDRTARQQQLTVVMELGHALDRLVHRRGLRSLLKMLRAPALAAGMGALQNFLESGFDAFAGMKGAGDFLAAVRSRESALITSLFDDDAVACETQLSQLLAKAPQH